MKSINYDYKIHQHCFYWFVCSSEAVFREKEIPACGLYLFILLIKASFFLCSVGKVNCGVADLPSVLRRIQLQ